ncbi:hypothetical protein [Candidatus Accumulibacter contiguus]|nr:hypothetical protein [Candidatus Accumulibacter contiguus]
MHPNTRRAAGAATFTATVAALVSTALHAADTQLDPIASRRLDKLPEPMN